MKIDRKLVFLWITSLALFTGAGIAVLTASDWMSGVQGLAIRFFLGYCGLIVVAQVCTFLEASRCRQEGSSAKHTAMESA